MEYSSARQRPRISQRSPLDGTNSVNLISSDRPQSAKVYPQHLSSDCLRFRQSNSTCVLLTRHAVAHRAAGHAVRLTRDGHAKRCEFMLREGTVIGFAAESKPEVVGKIRNQKCIGTRAPRGTTARYQEKFRYYDF